MVKCNDAITWLASGKYFPLDNFYIAPFEYQGKEYQTCEHAFQSMKTMDLVQREKIRLCQTPGEAKGLGQLVPMRLDWEIIKYEVMYEIVREKMVKYKAIAELLLSTGNREIVEGNNWDDNCWGNCICAKCKDIPGRNCLGIILMRIRIELDRKINIYRCPECGHEIITEQIDEGVTPFIVTCEKCGEQAISAMYQCNQLHIAKFEWFKPKNDEEIMIELRWQNKTFHSNRASEEELQHSLKETRALVIKGGLILRNKQK